MTKRIIVLAFAVGLLSMSSGCASTLLKSGYREFKQFDTSFLAYEEPPTKWNQQFSAVTIEAVNDQPINGRAPQELLEKLVPLASKQLADSKMFRSVNGESSDRTLLIRGEIIHVDGGGMAATRTVGFGESPLLIVRTTFVDGASGNVLARANLVSKVESAIQNSTDLLGRGYGAAIAKYLKETQDYTKLPE